MGKDRAGVQARLGIPFEIQQADNGTEIWHYEPCPPEFEGECLALDIPVEIKFSPEGKMIAWREI